MKNKYLVLAITMLCTMSMNAQKVAERNVPQNVKSEFKAKYPTSTNVKWKI